MVEVVDFNVSLKGGAADRHVFQAYEGFNSFAGVSWALTLVANYVETGKVRHKGNFPARDSVIAVAPQSGSVVVDYIVSLASDPALVFGSGVTVASTVLMRSLVQRVLSRNIGQNLPDPLLDPLLRRRGGDIEALVAATEPSVRQAHDVIGNGARQLSVTSGINLAKFDKKSKEYVRSTKDEGAVLTRDFIITGFYGNSGHGSVFDSKLGRNIPFDMRVATLKKYGPVFSWGLDQFTNDTGLTVELTFTRLLAMDGTPKKYRIIAAKPS